MSNLIFRWDFVYACVCGCVDVCGCVCMRVCGCVCIEWLKGIALCVGERTIFFVCDVRSIGRHHMGAV